MRLQKFQVNVQYKPDAHCRCIVQSLPTSDQLVWDWSTWHMVITNLPVSNEKFEEFRKETIKDLTLTKLSEAVLNWWPQTKSQAATEIQKYWNYRENISVVDRVLFRGQQLIVPDSMRAEMLKRIHESHLGVESCRCRAREVLFSPGMSQQITEMVNSHDVCSIHQKQQTIYS